MSIQPDQDIRADDFINESERDGTKTNDAGRVPKLESDGYLDPDFVKFTLPVVRVYTTLPVSVGGATTQFDITNPAGTTFRYTFDGTGTNPNFSAANNPVGSGIYFNAQNFNSNNNGRFVVTGSGANYVEVTNAAGVVESNKTIGTGSVAKLETWVKPAGLKYITVKIVAGGGGTGYTNEDATGGGGAGGYVEHKILASSLGAYEVIYIGDGGIAGTVGVPAGGNGLPTYFGAFITAAAGLGSPPYTSGLSYGAGSMPTGLGILIRGGNGGYASRINNGRAGGIGGASYFGGEGSYGSGGRGSQSQGGTANGNTGYQGVCIVTEFYI